MKNPYASFLDQLEKPARYIGGEKFMSQKSWDECSARMALCFPDTYEIGMSHLGMKILYEELNRREGVLAERCFAPWVDMEEQLRQRDLPLVTLESFHALKDFEVVGFSLQYEMSYSNILTMLDLGHIPLLQAERQDHHPFVTCGGPGATHPEPLAPFMDFVVVGDGEQLLPDILQWIGRQRQLGKPRREILQQMQGMVGIYVPSLYTLEIDERTGFQIPVGGPRVKRHMIASFKDYPFPVASPIPHMTAIFDRFSVELSRGCTEGCRFCQAGMIYRPVRERDPEKVIDYVLDGLKKGGFTEASLTCLSTADYSAVTPLLLELLDRLQEEGATLGISSLRAYGLDERVLDKMAQVKNTSLTFAPEAGTQRMRDVINKNISQEDLLETAHQVFKRGWTKMKLYFMIGLPTEEDEDVIGIMETAKKAQEVAKKLGIRHPTITVSVSSFVPKPHTPFQWSSMIELPEIARKQQLLWDLAKKYHLNFRKHFSKISYWEGVVARGDRRIADLILLAWKKGARFDGWDDQFKHELWLQALEELQIDADLYLKTIPLGGRLPWDHIDVGLREKFLEQEWKKATLNRLSLPCGKVAGAIVHHSTLESLAKTFDIDQKRLVCYHCGIACDLKGMVQERRDFLGNLGALSEDQLNLKSSPLPEGEVFDPLSLRVKRGHFVGFKYRLEYAKVGPLAFISHLDLQKVVDRVFRRAQMSVLKSEGHRLRSLISFGPALSLGICSLSEHMDVRVEKPWEDTQEILRLLNDHSERGLSFKQIELIAHESRSIQESLETTEYFFPLSEGAEVSQRELTEQLELLHQEAHWWFDCYSKKEDQWIAKDLKLCLQTLKVCQPSLPPALTPLLSEVTEGQLSLGILAVLDHGTNVGLRFSELWDFLRARKLPVEKPLKLTVTLANSAPVISHLEEVVHESI